MIVDLPEDAIAALRAMPLQSHPADPIDTLPLAHLQLRLQPVVRALRVAVEARTGRTARLLGGGRGLGAEHIEQMFHDIAVLFAPGTDSADPFMLSPEERAAEAAMRERAARAGTTLPLDALADALGLSAFELDTLLICTAPQLDLAFGRIFGFIHDDLNRLAPGPQLMALLSDASAPGRLCQRSLLAPHGKLLRLGLLRTIAETANELEREFTLAPCVLDALLRFDTDWARQFVDADEIATSDAPPLPLFPDAEALAELVPLLQGTVPSLIGLWGAPAAGAEEAAIALATLAGRSLRRLPGAPLDEAGIARALEMARALDAVLLVDVDALPESASGDGFDRDRIAVRLARHTASLVMVGRQPWRPPLLAENRASADLSLATPSWAQRAAQWQFFVPDASPVSCRELAGEFAFGPDAIRTSVASIRSRGLGTEEADDALRRAARAASMRRTPRHARVVLPRRQPHELILPPLLHRRVLEVAKFFRAKPRVDEDWGFGRLLGGGGMKVLMTGDSGTGKTAAAEVVAGQAGEGRPLFKVDLAGVVSKWVGETEKHLDEVFDHAEECNATLFFDEADALFAKRGEVERGSDRYANLEVGFLLQKLEAFSGLAILASNHKDQLDDAFMRRFQVVLHFPRPTAVERRALWRMALPEAAPVAAEVDLSAFDELDLTGAGIVNAARLAALLAAGEETGGEIGMRHLVAAIARQFQHESRLFTPAQMGAYAPLVADAA